MEILEKIEIKNKSDLIFLKHTLRNYEYLTPDISFYSFALMELGTNLLKHTSNGGYFYFLQKDKQLIIASLDYSNGIKDISWAIQKGHSSLKDSLGIGLYKLSTNKDYHFEIFSLEKEGTITLLYPKNLNDSIIYFSEPYLNKKNNGDFFSQKGKFFLFGDASGHTIKAKKTADYITKHFFNNRLSCIMIDEFFSEISCIIKQANMRSAVFCIIEKIKNSINICGVGNIDIWHLNYNSHKYHSLKNGIVGEVYSDITNLHLNLEIKDKLVLSTDGIRKNKLHFLEKLYRYSNIMGGLAMVHFAGDAMDDKSVLIIRNEV